MNQYFFFIEKLHAHLLGQEPHPPPYSYQERRFHLR